MSRRGFLQGAAAVGVGAIAGGGAYGYLYERHHLLLTRAALPVAGLPEALAGTRIGFLTDVHRSRWVSEDDVAAAVRLLMNERPDVIVLGGDYVTWADRQYMGPAAEALAPLSAPHGVFAILGNHDDEIRMPAALASHGIDVLRNARTSVMIRNEALELVGITFWTRRAADIAPLVRGAKGPVILLAHDPRRLAEAESLRLPTVLSGHTHGGQVVLPVLGAVAAQKFPVPSGFATRGTTTMFVSRGLGTVYVPVRLNCPPEVAILTLARA
ncbi:MAG TPA: metallophosphoesterase [Vicinamibacterales bacterium]|nr:metallophosphoesterase [Vicinamibacterales bacterium]